MIRFYCPDIADNPVLPESDSAHCVRVLRMQPGDAVEVVDGRGHVYHCRLNDAHPKRATLSIEGVSDEPRVWDYKVTLAVAPTKHLDRMEWMVEKLVEIGVDRIVPLLCARSERREIKVERLEKIAVSAMKQSLKATLPEICPMTPIKRFIAEDAAGAQRFVGYCDDAVERRLLAKACEPGRDTVIMIGPEGDFTPDEIHATLEAGFIAATFGDNRLRTETAALVGCDTIHIINQRLK